MFSNKEAKDYLSLEICFFIPDFVQLFSNFRLVLMKDCTPLTQTDIGNYRNVVSKFLHRLQKLLFVSVSE